MKCELCGDEAYGMIDGVVAVCRDCDTSCGSFEPSAEPFPEVIAFCVHCAYPIHSDNGTWCLECGEIWDTD